MPGPNQGIYGSMKFLPYRFTEYPKAVTRADGTKVRVESQREEIALTLDIGVAEAPAPNALQEQNVKLAQQVADMMVKKLGITFYECQIGPRGIAQTGLGKGFMQRAEDQGERGAQFVADVGKKLGL